MLHVRVLSCSAQATFTTDVDIPFFGRCDETFLVHPSAVIGKMVRARLRAEQARPCVCLAYDRRCILLRLRARMVRAHMGFACDEHASLRFRLSSHCLTDEVPRCILLRPFAFVYSLAACR